MSKQIIRFIDNRSHLKNQKVVIAPKGFRWDEATLREPEGLPKFRFKESRQGRILEAGQSVCGQEIKLGHYTLEKDGGQADRFVTFPINAREFLAMTPIGNFNITSR